MYFCNMILLLIDMQAETEKLLAIVAATLIDARCVLEKIETPDREINQLHGEISRAHALCSQLMEALRRRAQSVGAGGG